MFALAAAAAQADAALDWRESGMYDTAAVTPTGRANDLLDAAARVTVQDRRRADRKYRIGYGWYDAVFISLDNARKGGCHGLRNLPLSPAPARFSAGLAVSNRPDHDYDCFDGNATDAALAALAAPGVPRPLRAGLCNDF